MTECAVRCTVLKDEIRNRRHPRRVAEAGPLRLQSVSDAARLRTSTGPDQSGLRRNPRREMLSEAGRRAAADRYRHDVFGRSPLEPAHRRNYSGETAADYHE